MRPVVAALLFAFSSSQSHQVAQPQSFAPPPPLTEKIDVSVVNVDVTVTDREGRPVPGLTRNDFEILEDGKLQSISNFYAVVNAQAAIEAHAEAVTAAVSEPGPAPERYRRKVLVLIDNLNTSMHGRNAALDRLESFVNEHFDDGRYDWSLATIDSRVHLLLPMTSDKKVLHDVLSGVRHMASRREVQAPIASAELAANLPQSRGGDDRTTQQREQARNALSNYNQSTNASEQLMFASQSIGALAEAARAFGSSEGRKIILLVTGHLPLGSGSPLDLVGGSSQLGNHLGDIVSADGRMAGLRDGLVREANASNTSVYIISSEGLQVPGADASNSGSGSGSSGMSPGSAARDTGPMYWLARQTGGAYMPGNRIDKSLIDFDRRSASFYSLGYMPQHPDDSLYHRLTVRVKGHRDYGLQYRDGYQNASMDLQLMRTLGSSIGAALQASTMNVKLLLGKPQWRGIVAVVPIKAAMSLESLQYITDARGSHTRLHVYVSIFAPDGSNVAQAKAFADISLQPNESTSGPMTVTIPPLVLSRGTYRVVVALRDELTDHVGLVEQKIHI